MRHNWVGLRCRGGCERTLVSQRAVPDVGEARHSGHGRCSGCTTAYRRSIGLDKSKPAPATVISPARLRYLHEIRAEFEDDRRRRGIPEEGLRWAA